MIELGLRLFIVNGVFRCHGIVVGDEVSQKLLPVVGRVVKRNRFQKRLGRFLYPFRAHVQRPGNFLAARFAAQLLSQTHGGLRHAMPCLGGVDGDADGAGLIGHRAQDTLAHPPRRIGAEFEPFAVLEPFSRPHQSDVAFLNKIQQTQSPPRKPFRLIDHESKISLNQIVLRLFQLATIDVQLSLNAVQAFSQ